MFLYFITRQLRRLLAMLSRTMTNGRAVTAKSCSYPRGRFRGFFFFFYKPINWSREQCRMYRNAPSCFRHGLFTGWSNRDKIFKTQMFFNNLTMLPLVSSRCLQYVVVLTHTHSRNSRYEEDKTFRSKAFAELPLIARRNRLNWTSRHSSIKHFSLPSFFFFFLTEFTPFACTHVGFA